MRSKFFYLCLIMCAASFIRSEAQTYSNSWINFNNSYFKFKIAENGIYRISKDKLDSLGLGNVSGNQFAIFREGQEVPIRTTSNGVLGPTDYIEFYAAKADGKIDTELYPNPDYQPNIDLNLISDTAYYFLTHDNTPHLRYTEVNNPIPVPTPTPAPYCWSTITPTASPRSKFRPGKSHSLGEYFYSSEFDLGEGYSFQTSTYTFRNYKRLPSLGVNASLAFTASGQTIINSNHFISLQIGNIAIFDTLFNSYFDFVREEIEIDMSNIGVSNTQIKSLNNSTIDFYTMSLRYPRSFLFTNDFVTRASFGLPANEKYIEVLNYNLVGVAPDIYDLTNHKVYKGTVDGAKVKYSFDFSIEERDLFMQRPDSIILLNDFKTIQFRDYTSSQNQGNYIILSHQNYINASPNYLNDYKNYRASTIGGGYTPVIVDVTELYDQFGYGYDYHVLGIKKFLKYAYDSWTNKPEYLFIVGKGINYQKYQEYLSNATNYSYSPVPTWGDPGSDNLLSAFTNNPKPQLATGRLSAWNNEEIGAYLEKVKSYEAAQNFPSIPTVENDFWKKSGLHIAGASNSNFQQMLLSSLNNAKQIYEDTLIGGKIKTIAKSTTDPIDQVNNLLVDSLMNNGLGVVTFYGHASSSGFDYNLNNPDLYHSKPRYPMFFAFGCDVAHVFTLTQTKTISEQYLHSENGGSISMVAGNNLGYTNILPVYMSSLYQNFSFKRYGKTLGKQYQNNIWDLLNVNSSDMMAIHTQSLLLLGDPALKVFNPEKPDYVIENNSISTFPTNITTASDSFEIKAIVYNLGKAINDSVWVKVDHSLPGNNTILFSDSLKVIRLYHSDTLLFKIPIDPVQNIGLNNYTVTIDPQNEFDEISKQNNQAKIQVYIYSNNVETVYPYDFSIMNKQDIILNMSVLNAFAPQRNYKVEIDTTERFNSPIKQSTIISRSGGVLKWKPTLTYKDSTVYYWRAAVDSLLENGEMRWSNSSFIYLKNGSAGWNQSHVYQYLKDKTYGLKITESNRNFNFTSVENKFQTINKVINPAVGDYYNVNHSINDVFLDNNSCAYTGGIQVIVIDSVSGKPWPNSMAGEYGSLPVCLGSIAPPRFEFLTNDITNRNKAKDFLESLPNGNYISVNNYIHGGPPGAVWDRQAINEWMADTLVNGSGNSLYHTIKNMGFDQIDQFTSKKVFAFFRKKGNNSYPVYQVVAPDSISQIQMTANYLSFPDTGSLTSTIIGPALHWDTLLWKTVATDAFPQNDSPFVKIFGIDNQNIETELYSGNNTSLSLSFINASQYSKLKLEWFGVDNITRTSPHLKYWRVLYEPLPEAALNANATFQFNDSLHQGQEGNLKIAVENLSPYNMDSMLVKFKMIDANNVTHDFGQKRYRPLPGNDTLIAEYKINADAFPGHNSFFIEVNPDEDQPEQYHPNNIGFLNLYVQSDATNPLLDVTFDGVHILDRDIVSAKPFIKIELKDENKYLALNDSSLLTVYLLKPNSSALEMIPIDGTVCKFIPAQIVAGKANKAYIEYRPHLAVDGVYKLSVEGKDKSGNAAGNKAKYEINFTVENKPSITNVLNYPNPFSTSTQFIFTLTGSEIPSQFKIQILTVTGKVVKEITKNEIGNLRIGRNRTDYCWDGKDQYGQTLGNGVYLYRVITSIKGTDVEHRKNTSVDKYFKNGYGKMYIMR